MWKLIERLLFILFFWALEGHSKLVFECLFSPSIQTTLLYNQKKKLWVVFWGWCFGFFFFVLWSTAGCLDLSLPLRERNIFLIHMSYQETSWDAVTFYFSSKAISKTEKGHILFSAEVLLFHNLRWTTTSSYMQKDIYSIYFQGKMLISSALGFRIQSACFLMIPLQFFMHFQNTFTSVWLFSVIELFLLYFWQK